MTSRLIVRLFVCLLFCGVVIYLLDISFDRNRIFTKASRTGYVTDVQEESTPIPATKRVCTMAERRYHLIEQCRKKGLYKDTNKEVRHLIVDDKHKLIYCPLQKAACTSWKILLVYGMGQVPRVDWPPVHGDGFLKKAGLKMFREYTSSEKGQLLKDFNKFIVVRHPFDRLVSAWRDKLVMVNSPYRAKLGKQIIQRYRNVSHVSNFENSMSNNTVTFEEFTEMIADKNIKDPHWGPYTRCDPCGVHYDLILRTETTEIDFKQIMARMPDYRGEMPFIHSHSQNTHTLLAGKYLKDFEKVSPHAMRYIWETYGTDMDLFGYTWDNTTNRAKCEIHTQLGDVCC